MQKVIGLDLGSYSIKAVEIINTFSSYDISGFREYPLELGDKSNFKHRQSEALAKLFNQNDMEADRIVTALSGQFVTSRILDFEFSDPKKIAAAVSAEVEDFIPFDIDEMIVDEQMLGQTPYGANQVLAVMTRKTYMRNFLEQLEQVELDPKVVDIDSLSFYNLSSAMSIPPGRLAALVDIGHSKTSVCIVKDGVIRMFRTINVAGKFVTEFLARDREIDFSEAQEKKHEVSELAVPGQSPANSAIGQITLAMHVITKEIGRTFYAFKSYEKQPIDVIYLSGGTSRLKNIATYLSHELGAEVVKNNLFDSTLNLSEALAPKMAEIPQAIAIGMRGITNLKRVSQVNLRKGEFAFVQDYEKILKGAFSFMRYLAIAAVILFISYVLHSILYRSQTSSVHETYRKEVVKVFPSLKKKVKKKTSFKAMKDMAEKAFTKEATQYQRSVGDFIEGNKGSAALVILAQISEKIPKDVKLDTNLFQYKVPKGSSGKLVFQAEVDSYASGVQILEILKKIPALKNVIEKATKNNIGKPGKVYVIHAELNEQFNIAGGF
jgi:type IV pilus assembly protein PilM